MISCAMTAFLTASDCMQWTKKILISAKHQAYHGWCRCNGTCPTFVNTNVDPRPKPCMRTYTVASAPNVTGLGFFAEIHIFLPIAVRCCQNAVLTHSPMYFLRYCLFKSLFSCLMKVRCIISR